LQAYFILSTTYDMNALTITQRYYNAFNHKDWAAMLALLHPQVRHEPNQGEPRIGVELFEAFLQKMDECYDETLSDMVFFEEPSGQRIACEFVVNGIYKKGEDDLPPARGQSYVLPAAAFLEVSNDQITRITTYYNLPLWIALVSA
jgi:steroid delta-isomerase-like uncharacterized protein